MRKTVITIIGVIIIVYSCTRHENIVKVSVDWDQVISVSESSVTVQAIPNPSHQPGSPLREPLWNSLRDLKANYVRYSPWGLYPKLKIAELEPPTVNSTSWDFSSLDPVFTDFMNAMEGRSVVMNYQAIPEWMFVTPRPERPGREPGSLFRDPSVKELGEYFARIVSWYTKGGFTDELGKYHHSGHKYNIGIWEIMNEPDHETIAMTKELYTALYDAVAWEIMKVAPDMKFMGLSMSNLHLAPEWTEYFLDRRNHKQDIPLDMVSYHLYATLPASKNKPEFYPYTVFEQADKNMMIIHIADSIRNALSPSTIVDINESGILFKEVPRGWGRMDGDSFPDSFWNLSAAYYAYIYAGLTKMGIEIIGKSTLWSDREDWPEVSLLDWKTGKPNARYHVLKLLNESFGPGDKLVGTDVNHEKHENPLLAQGFITAGGVRRILLVNKTSHDLNLSIPGTAKGRLQFVDQTTGFEPPSMIDLKNNSLLIRGFGVGIVTLPQ